MRGRRVPVLIGGGVAAAVLVAAWVPTVLNASSGGMPPSADAPSATSSSSTASSSARSGKGAHGHASASPSPSGVDLLNPPRGLDATERALYVKEALPSAPFFGVTTPGVDDHDALTSLESKVGAQFTVWHQFQQVDAPFSVWNLQQLNRDGQVPAVTLETWSGGYRTGHPQPRWSLSAVTSGRYDEQLTEEATAVAQYGAPVVLRLDHEMNGQWMPWAEQENGNHPGQYVAMWKHVHDLFDRAGATNAIWVWCPNVVRGTLRAPALSELYPGDQYVDLVGVTGYGVHESTPDQTFDATLDQISSFTSRPALLAETGAEADSSKTSWITNLGPWLSAHPDVVGLIWFDMVTQSDWRLEDTPGDLAAFHQLITSPPHPSASASPSTTAPSS